MSSVLSETVRDSVVSKRAAVGTRVGVHLETDTRATCAPKGVGRAHAARSARPRAAVAERCEGALPVNAVDPRHAARAHSSHSVVSKAARSMINLRHLRAFKAVAEELHFTKAAEALCVSQPALSALIRQLEGDAGVQLILRNTRQVELTSVGVQFLGAVTKLLQDFDEAVQKLNQHKSSRHGQINVAVLPSLCTTVLPDVLRAFHAAHADVRVNVVDMPDESIMEAVRTGAVDFACTYAEPGADIAAVPFMEDALVIVCHRDRAIARHGQIRWNELRQEPVIAMAEGTTVRSVIQETLSELGLKLNVVLEPRVAATALAYAGAGLGVAILPGSSIPSDLPSRLTRIDLVDPIVRRQLCVHSIATRTLSPLAAAFRDLVMAAGRATRCHLR